MIKVTVARPADELLRELRRRSLIVKLETIDKRRNARHWHLGFEKVPGVLEVADLNSMSELKVAANRDGGWAAAVVNELSGQ